jgi:hypothetical protein
MIPKLQVPPDPGAMTRLLRDTLLNVPYNSATQILEYFADRRLPPRLGMSCAWQAFWIAERLQEKTSAAATFLRDERHVAAVYRSGNELAILDPYLLHQVPIRLDAAAQHDGTVRQVVDAYPVRSNGAGARVPSRLRATWDVRTDVIRLEYVRYSARRGHNYVYRCFTLRPEAVLTEVPSPPAEVRVRLLHPEQNNLSVRVVHPVLEELAEIILPLAGVSLEKPAKNDDLVSKNNAGRVSRAGSAGFDRDLGLVAEAVDYSPRAVCELLLETAALYANVAPADRTLAAYSLDDE